MSGAVQPGLRPFIVFDRVPEGCVAYAVPDGRHAPLLRAGEWVIADPSDRVPCVGELFVIQWQSGNRGPQIVEAAILPKIAAADGGPLWAVGARHRGTNAAALVFGRPGHLVGDFPYATDQLEQRFLGRVMGILETVACDRLRLEHST